MCFEASCAAADVKAHRGGTYLCMEGPAFSTVAESNVYRSWGMDIIGMTNLQEAKLAREAEICYATLRWLLITIAGIRATMRLALRL